MQVKSKRSRIFRSSNWTRGYKDRGGEGERCFRLANTKVCQGYSEVLGISELLLFVVVTTSHKDQ